MSGNIHFSKDEIIHTYVNNDENIDNSNNDSVFNCLANPSFVGYFLLLMMAFYIILT